MVALPKVKSVIGPANVSPLSDGLGLGSGQAKVVWCGKFLLVLFAPNKNSHSHREAAEVIAHVGVEIDMRAVGWAIVHAVAPFHSDSFIQSQRIASRRHHRACAVANEQAGECDEHVFRKF